MADAHKKAIQAMMEARLKEQKKNAPSGGPAPRRGSGRQASASSAPVRKTPKKTVGSVLVAVADKRVGLLLASGLKTARLEPIRTGNGKEAVMFFEAESPCLVMVDMGLEGMGVADTCHAIRARPEGLEVPILVLADAGTTSAKLEPIINAGITEVIRKPINTAGLIKRVRELIDYEARVRAAHPKPEKKEEAEGAKADDENV